MIGKKVELYKAKTSSQRKKINTLKKKNMLQPKLLIHKKKPCDKKSINNKQYFYNTIKNSKKLSLSY